jgi:hypothetical protein
MMKRLIAGLALSVVVTACGSSSSPSAPSTTPTQTTSTPAATAPSAPTVLSLSGTISFTGVGTGLPNASVTILDSVNAGKTTQTDTAGHYELTGLTSAGFNVSITSSGFIGVTRPVNLVTNTTLSVSLLPSQVFTQTGVGDNVFTIPAYVTKVRVDASYQGSCQNFIVNGNNRLLINVIIGSCSVADTRSPFSGTYAITGATQIAITSSTGIAWTFTEVRS